MTSPPCWPRLTYADRSGNAGPEAREAFRRIVQPLAKQCSAAQMDRNMPAPWRLPGGPERAKDSRGTAKWGRACAGGAIPLGGKENCRSSLSPDPVCTAWAVSSMRLRSSACDRGSKRSGLDIFEA
jgi:hypothetical protein